MARAPWTRVLSVLLIVSLGFVGILILSPGVQAAVWTQTTDADFNAGTLNGVEVLGTGVAAKLELLKDATDWTDMAPGTNPGAREGTALAYDSTNNVIVAFGGYSGINNGDTWEYAPGTNTWAQTTVTGPTGRAYSGIAYDSVHGVTVLFGGISDLDFEADTWEYNAATNTWTNTTPGTSPSKMVSYHLAFSSTQQLVLLFGMNVGTSGMETWAYDAAGNTWSNLSPGTQPSQRTNYAMAYHADLDRVVLFGGYNPFPPPGNALGDTWEFDWAGNVWNQITPGGPSPSARSSHGMSYRGSSSQIILFGGVSGVPLSDTWRYFDVGGTRQWVSTPTQRSPSPRQLFGFADETASGQSILYGGSGNGGLRNAETWSLGPAYRGTGTFESPAFDSQGSNTNWNWLAWNLTTQPAGTILRFQTAASNSPTGPWTTFVGPTGSTSGYYTTSGTAIYGGHDNNRYLKVRAYFLASDNRFTPSMEDVTVDYTAPATDPYLVLTDPVTAQFGVALDTPIFIRFSEPMNTGSVAITINPPLTTTRTWTEADSAVTLNHASPLLECQAYSVTVTAATDVAGNPLDNGLNLVPNPFSFVTLCVAPEITATNPSQGTVDVPLAAPIVVTFSEAMDTASVTWNITPAVTVTDAWSGGDSVLTLSHATDFVQCTMYTVTVNGQDLAGQGLVPGSVPNPWDFMSVCTIPYIVSTDPSHLATNVAPDAAIVVVFSEPMLTSSVTYTIGPPTTLSSSWSNGDRTLTLTHATPWSACTMVTMEITGGTDLDGNALMDQVAPNPWQFAVQCASPFIVFTVPWDGALDVNLSADIVIQFSEAMNTGSVIVTVSPPLVLTYSWTGMNQVLMLSHALPFSCGLNTVDVVSGTDPDGNPLVPGLAPSPFSFTPFCPNPFIMATDPFADETGVAVSRPVVITFSEPMNRASVVYDIVPANFGTITEAWSGGDSVLTLNHVQPFNQSLQYTVLVLAGQDVDGNDLVTGPAPNPWRFTTGGVNPYVTATDPVHGAIDVPTGSNVVITFSETMNRTTVLVTPSPAIFLAYTWQNNDTELILSHITAFAECTVYAFTVAGNDMQGDPLVVGPVPNPFSFTTVCFAPQILNTNPVDGATQVPVIASIWVNFSEPMDTVLTTATISPVLALTYVWSNGDQTVEIRHAIPFSDCTLYTVTVSGQDATGTPLGASPVPNPWDFTAFCPAPTIVSTVPADGATNVPTTSTVVVTFSKAMDTATVTWTFTPGATVTSGWTVGNTVLTLTPSPPFLACTNYQVLIAGKDTVGTDLVAGPVPNPWTFSTVCTVAPPANLQAAKVAPNIVRLTWNAVVGADLYRVYESQDRFAAWPWTVLGTSTLPTFDAAGHGTDASNHFYIVRAVRTTVESTNSTMGAKIHRTFAYSASGTNVHWFSLPYRSAYARASDITTELGPGQVDVIGKWDRATQSSVLYYWFRGAWRGTDFTIAPGDGVFFGAVTSFSWDIVGSDRQVSLPFTLNAPPLGNVHWFSLPYGMRYSSASDIVVDIEGGTTGADRTYIVEIVKWDSATQSVVRYYWSPGGWIGSNFSIAPGEGLYIQLVSNLTWPVDLVTPEVP